MVCWDPVGGTPTRLTSRELKNAKGRIMGKLTSTGIGCLTAATLVCAPSASASPYCTQVRTTSGKVECIIGSAAVHCYAESGFQGSPSGTSDYLASVTSDGAFAWQQAGGLGNCDGANVTTLPYGSDNTFNGWDVRAAEEGTTFVSNASGRGMFVSIQSTHAV